MTEQDNKNNVEVNKIMDKMSYELDTGKNKQTKQSLSFKELLEGVKEFSVFLKGDELKLVIALALVIINSAANVLTPYVVAKSLDTYISVGDMSGLKILLFELAGLYLVTLVVGYYQARMVGNISQRTLFRLREALFEKLESLPIAFFSQNKSGDLISRINNDTDKLNQFLSDWITRFVGTFFSLFGILAFVLYINPRLGLAMLSTTLILAVVTRLLSPWIERSNKKSLTAQGNFSASLQENLTNFRVIVAYSKRDYLKKHLSEISESNFKLGFRSGTANRIFEPIYDFAGSLALIVVLSYGIYLISIGNLTIGLLVAYMSYTQKFYDPLRIMATIFGALQLASAAWSRIREVFNMQNNLRMVEGGMAGNMNLRMELQNVSFSYEGGGMVVENVNLNFEPGKTYALVGPTGGGKSTLASIMSHLYDPTEGNVFLNGKNICAYTHEERAKFVSVILQDPILFTGSVADNIRYGNNDLQNVSDTDLVLLLKDKGLGEVMSRFESGLLTRISQGGGGGLSIGQKQLISFMRAILREPELLILDEATANIDTITEAILTKALDTLPTHTTKVIIAHRLNTIQNADRIMFVNGHHVTEAGSFEEAVRLIKDSRRVS